MNLPQQPEQRDIRYPLHFPVTVKLAKKEMHARSENISLGGILLSSAFLIPEGSTVELAVEAAAPADPGTLLSARGKVLRAQPKATGDFAIAIKLERSFPVPLQSLSSDSPAQDKEPPFAQGRNRTVTTRSLQFTPAWHTET